jgi:hypothetical protein
MAVSLTKKPVIRCIDTEQQENMLYYVQNRETLDTYGEPFRFAVNAKIWAGWLAMQSPNTPLQVVSGAYV